jgi:hypothetical protein
MSSITISLAVLLVATPAWSQLDVPLVRYRTPEQPAGPQFGNTAGVSFLDYDGDGWIDLYAHYNGRLWHNDEGRAWSLAANLGPLMPDVTDRYGSVCGDYDNDGLPDIATEQRQSPNDDCFHLLHNLGDGQFEDVAGDPSIVIGQPCEMWSESGCWADFDADGDLDLWITAYPNTGGGGGEGEGGNQFWENLGPSGPGGAYQLELRTQEAGLDNGTNVSRPEGAAVVDVDHDGDLDAYANGTLYMNITTERPLFKKLTRGASGIRLARALDEGAAFADYDLDGDQDLFCLYIGNGNRLWENRGDGTFFEAEGAIENPGGGAAQGLSLEDWDLDGDLDLTTTNIFRRNLFVETGERFFRFATHELGDDVQFPSPAWGDWDRDGDMDVVMSNFRSPTFLFENTTYDASTPRLSNRTVRFHVVRDHPDLPRGLETEYGATVELRVRGDVPGRVYQRFVSSAHGYLQQSEYDLTFALPAGPNPGAPAAGVLFDARVDFSSLPQDGLLRIDPEINPALGRLNLAALQEREVIVFRSGRVVIDGHSHPPRQRLSHTLTTSSGGLATANPMMPMPEPVPPPAEPWFVGLELDTTTTDLSLAVRELVLDGGLAAPIDCHRPFNVALWDVTTARRPRLAWSAELTTNERNRRHFLPVEFTLHPHRHYRLVCRVDALRGSPVTGPTQDGPLRTVGGLSFADDDPCSGRAAARAEVDPNTVQLAVRFRTPSPPPGSGPDGPGASRLVR